MINYGKHFIDKKDIEIVKKTLKSSFLTQGPKVDLFEKKLKKYLSSNYVLSCSTGTAALHLSCQALGLSKGDYLWTTPITFVASANCAYFCGSKIDFVDIDKNSWNIDIKKLNQKLIEAKIKKKLPKIIIVVHLGGASCDMISLKSLSKKFKFKIIEDACHGLGGKYNNFDIGSCKYSDISTFSFHPVKSITTAEGGAISTNSKKIYERLKILRHHGIIKSSFNYDIPYISNNYRLSDLHSALGISQLSKLKKFIEYRKKISKFYNKHLTSKTLINRVYDSKTKSAYHLYIVRSKKIKNSMQKKKVFQVFKKNKINLGFHYPPIYNFSSYKTLKFNKKNFLESEKYSIDAFSIPIYYKMSFKNVRKVCRLVNKYL